MTSAAPASLLSLICDTCGDHEAGRTGKPCGKADNPEGSRCAGTYVAAVTIVCEIENGYELYDDVTTHRRATIPAPPWPTEGDEFDDWASEHIFSLTGVGHDDGDSWYDVTITESTDPTLVGMQFEWGY